MAYFIHDEELGYIFYFLISEFLLSNNSFNGLQSGAKFLGKCGLEIRISPFHKVFFPNLYRLTTQPFHLFLNLFIFILI